MMNRKKKHITEEGPAKERYEATKNQGDAENSADESLKSDNLAEETTDEIPTDWEEKYNQMNDSYLRLMAEFDNYRKRTLREKAELIKSGGEGVLTELLPVIDDFERALNNVKNTDDITAVIQGLELIYAKFVSYLQQQGVKVIETKEKPFDTELYEAIATIPAPKESLKGKILDCIQTGYTMRDKVIRHAKVVVGE
jgi:molecular chaperone GrpE